MFRLVGPVEFARAAVARLTLGMTPFERVSWFSWSACMLVMSVIVALRPSRGITHVYRVAAYHWWAGEPIYSEGVHGFLYLPSSAVLFSPFAFMPFHLGGMAWRWTAFVLLTWAVCRLTKLALPDQFWRSTLCLILLAAIPASTVNLVRAQSEVIMVALMIHAAVDIGRFRWWRATIALSLAVGIKPLALVMLLLVAVVVPQMRWRLALGMVFVLLLPFVNPDPFYVMSQYQAMAHKLMVAVAPGPGRWNELTALLRHFQLDPSEQTMTVARLIGAAGTLGLATLAMRRHGQARGSIILLALAVCYQLLFNPRTEDGSYLNLAMLAGMFAGISWYVENRRWPACGLIILCLGLGTHMYGDWIYRPTDLWLKPLLGVVFALYLVHRIFDVDTESRGCVGLSPAMVPST